MKESILKFWLPRLAMWLADNSKTIIADIRQAIADAETEYPTVEDNSHREKRFTFVRTKTVLWLKSKSAWAVNVIIEMLVAYARLKGGGGK